MVEHLDFGNHFLDKLLKRLYKYICNLGKSPILLECPKGALKLILLIKGENK